MWTLQYQTALAGNRLNPVAILDPQILTHPDAKTAALATARLPL
jgi:hypothetical protein